jgi:tetratricopeptide (TPR) repeat protein/transcriptional regulator with XRE-family HTH domain
VEGWGGIKLKNLRESQGLSIDGLVRKANKKLSEWAPERKGIDRKTVIDIEQGRRKSPRAYTKRTLAEALGVTVDYFDVDTPILHSPPPLPLPLIGRDKEKEDIKSRLGISQTDIPEAPSQQVIALHGLPGVGKSALANSLGKDQEIKDHFKDGIPWIPVGKEANLPQCLIELGKKIGLPFLVLDSSYEELLNSVKWSIREKRILIIIDDVWEPEEIICFQNVLGNECALLFTTRSREIAYRFGKTEKGILELEGLTEESGLDLLHLLVSNIVDNFPSECQRFVRFFDGLPLAICVAGPLMRLGDYKGEDITRFIQELEEEYKLLLEEAPEDLSDNEGKPQKIYVLLKRSTDALSAKAQKLFSYLGAYSPKPASFDRESLKSIWDIESPRPFLDEIINLGLLEVTNEKRLEIHALLNQFASYLLHKEQPEKDRDIPYYNHARHYLSILSSCEESLINHTGYYVTFRDRWHNEFAQIKRGQAWVVDNTNGNKDVELQCDDYASKIKVLDVILSIKEKIHLFSKALEVSRRIDRRKSEMIHQTSLGVAHTQSRDFLLGIHCYNEALEISKELDERDVGGQILSNISSSYRLLHDWDKAIEYAAKSYKIGLDSDNKETQLSSLFELGMICIKEKNYTKSFACFSSMIRIGNELGNRNLNLEVWQKLGYISLKLNDVEATKYCLLQARDILKKFTPNMVEEPGRIEFSTLRNLGELFKKMDKIDDMLMCLEDGVLLAQKIGDDVVCSHFLSQLFTYYYSIGRVEISIIYATKALELARRTKDRSHECVQLGLLSKLYLKIERDEEALRLGQEALSIMDEVNNPGHIQLKRNISSLVELIETLRI